MTGPGHAEKEALQCETEEEAVAGQTGAEARSVREREEGAGLGFPHISKAGVLAAPLGGVGGVLATLGRARATAGGIPSPQSPYMEGVGKDGELGEGNPSRSNGRHPSTSLEEEWLPPRTSRMVLSWMAGSIGRQKSGQGRRGARSTRRGSFGP